MAREKLKPLLISFTADGNYLAVLSPNGTVRVWSTTDESLLAEWQHSDSESAISSSCMALSFVGKKPKKGRGKCLLALGAKDGNISTIDAFTGEMKWKFSECSPGGVADISFLRNGRHLCVIGNDGTVFEMNSETGECLMDLKVSKRPISSVAFSCDEKLIALASRKMRILELENGKELLKFPTDVGSVNRIAMSDNGKTVITSEIGQNYLQVWNCDYDSGNAVRGPALTLSNAPVSFECRSGGDEQDSTVVLAILQSGPAYLWNLKNVFEDGDASKISVKPKKSIFAAKLLSVEAEKPIVAVAAYGSVDSPKFSHIEISRTGGDVVINPKCGPTEFQDKGVSTNGGELADAEARMNRKRSEPDPDLPTTRAVSDSDTDGVLVDDDPNEPTMGEKLASLNLLDNDKRGSQEPPESSLPDTAPPTAASVNVLLKQALHADDRALLLDCLYNRDEKVIANSVATLNSSDVLKLLNSLLPIIQSRGALLACAIPWIKSLLLKHTGGIMSQESSLQALNTMYQLIESRISTLQTAVEVSSSLDFLYTGIVKELDEGEEEGPVIYEFSDDTDDEEEGEAMETGEDEEEEAFDDSDLEGFDDDMSE
ncbi:PREDICTED: WD repeat-containing protein 43 isoform X2 [Tarenaya hassleriana]|uniref:WD repeat-containing protein 43 isoform X2 n=1 Tax=Tarenaya hassleriana TaxID=28532 RepID=UPI00053C97AC|nr:PREDICTED: WD repeat-containing protein 43 isoform X2 [Tarenaya hassleriana]